MNIDEYHLVTKLSSQVKWYCPRCARYIADLLKMKMVQNKEDWPSILNVVLSSLESNSEVTMKLAERVEGMEKLEAETRSKIVNLRDEIRNLKVGKGEIKYDSSFKNNETHWPRLPANSSRGETN